MTLHESRARDLARGGSRNSWMLLVGLSVVAFALGFLVVGRFRLDGPPLGAFAALCRSLGLTPDVAPASEPQPPLRTPSEVAWTARTLDFIAAGDATHGAFIAVNCSACHGIDGISHSALVPTLAGLDAAVIYKELADYRSGKRLWGVMNALAKALSPQDAADVGAYYAHLPGGLPTVTGLDLPAGGRSLRQTDPALRLVFAGDPARGIAPCAVCHGPSGYKVGAPALAHQGADYLERQTAAFATGARANDIDEQMRTIAAQLTPEEMLDVAVFYAPPSAR
jgi:cytochrome c553